MAAGLIRHDSDCAAAIALGLQCAPDGAGPGVIHARYDGMSPIHPVNNLALAVWGLVAGADDFSTAIGDTVAAGLDTDRNGATAGGLWGITGRPIPDVWTTPWAGRVGDDLGRRGWARDR